MLQKFVALILGILFVFIFFQNDLPLATIAFYIMWFTLGATVINAFFLRREIKKIIDLSYLVFPALFIWAGTLVVFSVPSGLFRILILFFTGLLLISVESRLAVQTHNAFDENLFFLASFGLFLGTWAMDFYFNFNWWLLVLTIFFLCFLLLWSSYYPLGTTLSRKLLYCLFLAFLLSQAAWILLFWSMHYFTIAVIFSGLFYLAWIISRFQLEARLTRKRVYFHSILVTVLEAAVLVSSRWLPPK